MAVTVTVGRPRCQWHWQAAINEHPGLGMAAYSTPQSQWQTASGTFDKSFVTLAGCFHTPDADGTWIHSMLRMRAPIIRATAAAPTTSCCLHQLGRLALGDGLGRDTMTPVALALRY